MTPANPLSLSVPPSSSVGAQPAKPNLTNLSVEELAKTIKEKVVMVLGSFRSSVTHAMATCSLKLRPALVTATSKLGSWLIANSHSALLGATWEWQGIEPKSKRGCRPKRPIWPI